jgi:hypothetical protein
MISCCVNPACRAEFRSLNTGALYAVERRCVNTEFFWLCSACVPMVALSLDPMWRVTVRPQSGAGRSQPPHPDGYLRLVVLHKPRTPSHRTGLARGLRVPSGYGCDPLPSSSEAA